MYFGGSLIGISFFQQITSSPIALAYDKITMYGDTTIDSFQLFNNNMTDEDFDAYDFNTIPVWGDNTLAMSNFTNKLTAGNTILVNPLTGWDIYRRETGTTVLKFLGTTDDEIATYSDYEAPSGKNYQHVIFPKTATEIGEPIITESVPADFYGWFLIGDDSDGKYVYKFDMDVDFGGYQNEEDFTEHATYNKYNAFAKGSRDFLRGTIRAYAGTIETDGSTLQPVEYLADMRTRINDSTTKILKSRKGEIWKVKTHAFSMTPIHNGIAQQPYYIGFEFIECEEV